MSLVIFIRLTRPVTSLCHWAPTRVHGDMSAWSIYDRITLPVNCCYVHKGDFMYIFFFDFFSLFMIIFFLNHNFLATLWVPSVTSYAFFDGTHISHTYHVKIILVIVNYFFILWERWKQIIELNWIALNNLECLVFTAGINVPFECGCRLIRPYNLNWHELECDSLFAAAYTQKAAMLSLDLILATRRVPPTTSS